MSKLTFGPILLLAASLTACGGAAAPNPAPTSPASASAPAGAAKPAAGTTSASAKPVAASSYTAQNPLSPPLKLKVIDSSVTSQIPFYLAADHGYFKEEGLDVELVPMTNTATFVQAVALNQVAFAITNPDPVIFNAIDRGVDVGAIASSTVNQKGDHPAEFMVRQDLIDSGKYKQPADLKGMNVAAQAANAQFYVDRFLSGGNLTLKDINIINVGVQDVLASFRNKGIDAGWETEPLATQAEKQGLAKSVALTGDLFPGAVAGVLLMSPRFGQEQPDGVRHFAIAYLRGLREYYHAFNKKDSGDRASIIQSLISHTPVKDPALYDVIGLPSFEPNGAVDPTPSWSVFQDFFVKQGLQQRKVDVSKYVDLSFINAAIDRLGREG